MKKILLFLSVLGYVIGCDESPNEPKVTQNSYPIKIDNRWNYTQSYEINNVRIVEPRTKVPNEVLEADISVSISKDTTLLGYEKAFVFQEIQNQNDLINIVDFYYVQKPDGLYLYGHKNYNRQMSLPKIKKGNYIEFYGQRFTSINEMSLHFLQTGNNNYSLSDTILFESKPKLSLKLPLSEGSEWTYQQKRKPYKIDKKITRLSEISTQIGNLLCYEIQWLFDIDDDGNYDNAISITDYVGDVGMVRRIINYKNSRVIDSHGKTLYWFDAIDKTEITEVNLQ